MKTSSRSMSLTLGIVLASALLTLGAVAFVTPVSADGGPIFQGCSDCDSSCKGITAKGFACTTGNDNCKPASCQCNGSGYCISK